MDNSIIALFVADVILMGGIVFVLVRSRGKNVRASDDRGVEAGTESDGRFTQVLKDEMDSFRERAAEIEKKEAAIGLYENDIERKVKKLDAIIKRAEEAARDVESASANRLSDDVYMKAAKMMSRGMDPEDVKRSLGLLNGEAELVSSLRNFRA